MGDVRSLNIKNGGAKQHHISSINGFHESPNEMAFDLQQGGGYRSAMMNGEKSAAKVSFLVPREKSGDDDDAVFKLDVNSPVKNSEDSPNKRRPKLCSKALPVKPLSVSEDDIYGERLKRLPQTDQIRELQTVIRDKVTSRSDFIFYSDRLIRLIIEEGLNQLPYTKCTVTTPTGLPYEGLRYRKGNCGVSIIRSGEAMEKGLRECCRSIRIGKILVQSNEMTHEARVLYTKFPPDINERKVMLMYPIMGTGNTVSKSVSVLKQHGVREENIILLNLFCSPDGLHSVMNTFPHLTILTSEVHEAIPYHFGEKYFGTGDEDVV